MFGASFVDITTQIRKCVFYLMTLNVFKKRVFLLNGKSVVFYTKGHNINNPRFRMTERCLELALADLFLKKHSDVTEVGAVTPYYWPNRVRAVVDPYDRHKLVTDRIDWLQYYGEAEAILSISTFEHIGSGDYGLDEDSEKCQKAFEKLVKSTSNFLVTWPGGYNHKLDKIALSAFRSGTNFRLYIWQRGLINNNFVQVEIDRINQPVKYGPYWANVVFAMHRGPPLI